MIESPLELDDNSAESLFIRFYDCEYGWIHLRLDVGVQIAELRLSHVYDPFSDLMAWLESIVIGVPVCAFDLDEEGHVVTWQAKRFWQHGKELLHVTLLAEYEQRHWLDILLPSRVWVAAVYGAMVRFSESPDYRPEHWERKSLRQAFEESTGQTAEAWLETLLGLSRREVQKAIWRFAPEILYNPYDYPDTRDCIGTSEELFELTGRTQTDEHPGLPSYWLIEGWETLDLAERRKELLECLDEKVNSWGGLPLRQFRSKLIENWLQSDKPYWGNWIVNTKPDQENSSANP